MDSIFIIINNRNNFVIEDLPEYHPRSKDYRDFWFKQRERCIEGFWGIDDEDISINIINNDPYKELKYSGGKWRYMPPVLYFYINYCTILARNPNAPKTAPQHQRRPSLRDFDWEFQYNWIEARGFSGFEDDEIYSCHRDLIRYKEGRIGKDDLHSSCINKKGQVKEYITARVYLRQLFEKPLGRPIYENTAKNFFLLTARGVGKSYSTAAIAAHEIEFDGVKYVKDLGSNSRARVTIGAAIKDKSHELIEKVVLTFDKYPGGWKKGTLEEVPSPFSKIMSGSLAPSTNNIWRHEYKVYPGGKIKGSGSGLKHVIFTAQNPSAAVGGRNTIIICEESGLVPNITEVHSANEANQIIDGYKFGSSLYIGTGGDIDKIIGAKTIFMDPENYNMLAFDDIWENTGKIGWFVPAIYCYNDCKDKNGNTILEKAQKKYDDELKDKKKAQDSSALDGFLMYFPSKPSEIFLSAKGNKFPLNELNQRKIEIISGKFPTNTGFLNMVAGDIKWNTLTNNPPIRKFPLGTNDSTIGCVEFWEPPFRGLEDGKPTANRYIAGLDPVDDDEDNTTGSSGRSLQSFWILDLFTNRLVLEYTSRTEIANDFYEQVRLALLWYNAKVLYENQKKGFFTYMNSKNCLHLLEDTPIEYSDREIIGATSKNINKGLPMNKHLKIHGIDLINEWLREQAINKEEGMSNVSTLKSLALVEELLMYNNEINADRVSSLIMLFLYKELKDVRLQKMKSKKKVKHNNIKFLQRNTPKLFQK